LILLFGLALIVCLLIELIVLVFCYLLVVVCLRVVLLFVVWQRFACGCGLNGLFGSGLNLLVGLLLLVGLFAFWVLFDCFGVLCDF